MYKDAHSLHRLVWEAEHASPKLFPQLDSEVQSGGVERFCEWMKCHIDYTELESF